MQALLDRMDVGVAVFFVISGFLLFRPFVGAVPVGRAADAKPARSSAADRCGSSRATGSRSRSAWCSSARCSAAVKNAFLVLLAAVPVREPERRARRRSGPGGQLRDPAGVEPHRRVRLYLVLPVVAILLVRLGAKKAPQVQVRNALADLRRCSTWSGSCSASTSWSRCRRGRAVAIIWAPNWVDFFAIGMATATFSAAHHAGHAAAVAAAVPRRPPGGVVVHRRAGRASFATFSPPATPGVYGAEYWVRWFLFGVFAFFLLAPAMFGDQTQGLGPARSWPASRW